MILFLILKTRFIILETNVYFLNKFRPFSYNTFKFLEKKKQFTHKDAILTFGNYFRGY